MLQLVISGLAAGSSYALVALALVLVIKATDVPNFAQAEIGLVAAFVTWSLMIDFGLTYWLAVPVGLCASVLLGLVIDRLMIRPILAESHFATVLMTIGVMVVISSVIPLVWGANPRPLDSPFSGSMEVGGQFINYEHLVAICIGLAVAVGLAYFFRSPIGVQMQAIAEDRVTPRLLGVNVGHVFAVSWGAAAAISGLAVILLTQTTVLSDHVAGGLIIKGFVAATLGGFSSVTGAFIGGLFLGVLENLAGGYISTASESAVALLVVVGILMLRPQGLFGRVRPREV